MNSVTPPAPSNSSPPNGRPLTRDLAVAAWVAPLVALLLNGLAWSSKAGSGQWAAKLASALLVLGLIASILALFGVSKHGRRGILMPALCGLLLAAAMFAFSAIYVRRSAPPPVAADDPFLGFPGWYGEGFVQKCRLSFASINDDSPLAHRFNQAVTNPVSILTVALDNTNGTNSIVIQPASIHLVLPDRTAVVSIPPETVLSGARTNAEALLARFGGAITVPPGQQVMDRSAFFPHGTDFSKIAGVGVKIGDKDFLFPGKVLSVAEKKAIVSGAPPPSK
jgi:hypothetical protein